MSCPACGDCRGLIRRLVSAWYQEERKPRLTHDEAVTARVARAKAVSARREFNARRRAERAARLAAKEVYREQGHALRAT